MEPVALAVLAEQRFREYPDFPAGALFHETDPGNTIRSDLELLFDSGFGASAARCRLTKPWLN
jgi:hypothetical protein